MIACHWQCQYAALSLVSSVCFLVGESVMVCCLVPVSDQPQDLLLPLPPLPSPLRPGLLQQLRLIYMLPESGQLISNHTVGGHYLLLILINPKIYATTTTTTAAAAAAAAVTATTTTTTTTAAAAAASAAAAAAAAASLYFQSQGSLFQITPL